MLFVFDIAAMILWSLIADYFNLLKTRLVIRVLNLRTPRALPLMGVAITDFGVAVLVFSIGMLFAISCGEALWVIQMLSNCPSCADHRFQFGWEFFTVAMGRMPAKLADFMPEIASAILTQPLTNFYGILFSVGLLPSVWLWMYIGSALLTRLLAQSRRPFDFLFQYALDVDKHPFRSVGLVATAVCIAIYILYLGLRNILTAI
jgi:hypothetical protein